MIRTVFEWAGTIFGVSVILGLTAIIIASAVWVVALIVRGIRWM